jgi:hypothetical protein
MRQLGARWTRYDFAWSALEPRKGLFRFGKLERAVLEARTRGLSVVAMLGYAPSWANGGHGDKYPPRRPSDYGRFAGRAAAHFAPLGVHFYELWNEPNTSTFFKPSPNAGLYAAMVKAAYTRIKRADPNATVLAGSLAPRGSYEDVNCDGARDTGRDRAGVNPIRFLARLYADGAGNSFDVLSVHPYAAGGLKERCSAWAELEQTKPSLRSVMRANGDSAKKIWATEYGNALSWVGGNEKAAATRLKQALALWKTYPWAGPLFVFNLWDAHGSGFGLLRADWSRRPMWFAFRRAAAR